MWLVNKIMLKKPRPTVSQITMKTGERSHTKLYKELETINFRALDSKDVSGNKNVSIIQVKNDSIQTSLDAFRKLQIHEESNNQQEQYQVFIKSMKLLLFTGQVLALFPVQGIFSSDANKVRYTTTSWRVLHSALFCLIQGIVAIFFMFNIFNNNVTITHLAFVSFYGFTCATTYSFIRAAAKWPRLVQDVATSGLNEYINPNINFKCNVATAVFLLLALIENMLSFTWKLSTEIDCHPERDPYERYVTKACPFLFDLGVPYSLPLGVVAQIFVILTTISWNYSDLFIVCISFYLTSILNLINKKIVSTKGTNASPCFWRMLREDYTRATRLVRRFDEVISSVVFISFSSNLFFICLQLFNVFAHGSTLNNIMNENCPNYPSGPFFGYEHLVYFTFSLVFILGRFLGVSLIAANVHTASMSAAPALYEVSSLAYCDEVQRFIDQIHGDYVAFSGLQFFYVTKDIILTVAGTVVTYELVLLQFNGENMIHKN